MTFITISVDNVTPATSSTISVNFHWSSTNGTNFINDSGNQEFDISLLTTVINQNIISYCMSQSAAGGITIGALDKKILCSGLQ